MPERMSQIRKELGLTQEQLAARLGVSRVMVLACEHVGNNVGRTPGPRVLKNLASILGVPPLWLLGATADPSLAQLRVASGFLLADVANALGVSTNTVSAVERGKAPLEEERGKLLAQLYGVSVEEIIAAHGRAVAKRSDPQGAALGTRGVER
jgi:transcriptional regulator with XRE-family HTH domain